ncbi:CYFA0S18e01860g1_1 [Cyberlindnera fabianii]|uniref:CYFA0S18e01860g1_1 n=1 Tax=Cyberlindnera fabianii TaxID=36022 RepID=A0A061B6D7_CYBFA|nr:hypothetical protein BON22_1099 [Cyberlindnera fabianii]CDR45449.1 CYFA0S18e01860g1_1 [Cyberlindnera fabianii]
MSLIDVSSKFSFTNTRPVCSPCGHYIAYIHSTRVIIRETTTLERVRTIPLSVTGEFVKVGQIAWEPMNDGRSRKFAIVLQSAHCVKVFDVIDDQCDVLIQEDELFGVDKVEWLSSGRDPIETAYSGSKQIAVYSDAGLMLKVYSLDYYRSPLLEIEKPVGNIITRHAENMWSVVAMRDQRLTLIGLLNRGSESNVIYQTQLKDVSSVEKFVVSPDSKWIACLEKVLSKISISVFSLMGDVTGSSGSLLRYTSYSDPLGGIDVEFVDDDTLLVSDHKDNLHLLSISNGLALTQTLSHNANVHNTDVWRQNNDNTKFLKRSSPISVPRIENLPYHSQGVSKFKVSGSYIIATTHSMPTTAFIWRINDTLREPVTVLITNSTIRNIETDPSTQDFFIISTEDSICLWDATTIISSSNQPITLPVYTDNNSQLRGLQIVSSTQTTIKILAWTSDRNFFVLQSRLSHNPTQTFDNMDTQEISLLRRGSPALVDDSSRIMDLAAGVQQSEWGQNLTKSLHIDDTFLGRKRARRIDPLIR